MISGSRIYLDFNASPSRPRSSRRCARFWMRRLETPRATTGRVYRPQCRAEGSDGSCGAPRLRARRGGLYKRRKRSKQPHVTQQDLQREFYTAHRNAVSSQLAPTLSLPRGSSVASDVTGILQAIAATRHLLEMYRRQSGDEQTSKKLRRLAHRLLTVATDFRRFATAEK
jgi:hypothetical protein